MPEAQVKRFFQGRQLLWKNLFKEDAKYGLNQITKIKRTEVYHG
jgi:hypothetical protein